jgi:hypothetical protein
MANVPVVISRTIIERTNGLVSSPPATDFTPNPLNPDGSGGGGGTFISLTDTPQTYVGQNGKIPFVDELNNQLIFGVLPNLGQIRLISGGIVQWSGTGFVFNVSRAIAEFNGFFVDTLVGDIITLDAADTVNDRIDVIFVDIDGNFGKITGTPSVSPIKPQVNPLTQIELTSIIVQANATTPIDTTTETVYDENTEWTVSFVGTGTGVSNSTNDPYEGSLSIETTTISQNYLIRFDNGTDYNIEGGSTLGMFLNLKGVVFSAQELTAQWLDASNNPLGNEVILSFDKNLVGTYQFVAVAIGSFGLNTNLVRKLQIAFRRTRGGTTQAGFFLDLVKIQEGVTVPPSGDFVPYLGAVKNVDLGGYGIKGNDFRYNTEPVNLPTVQGSTYWDVDDNTIAVVLNGYVMKVGEDVFYAVKNQTGSTITKGTACGFAGTVGSSGRLLTKPYLANGSESSTFFMGVAAEEILDGEDGKVLWFGRIRGLNTNSFDEGDILYVSTSSAGGFQTTVPQAPYNIIQVAAVITKSTNQGTIFVRPTIGSNINKDEGVKIDTPLDGQTLIYNSTNGLFENDFAYPEAVERENNTVLFDKNYIIGNAAARTGNILFDFTGAKLGAWTEMRHADASAFTFPAEAKLMFDSADISTTDDNFFLFVLTKKSSTQIVKVFHAIEGGV